MHDTLISQAARDVDARLRGNHGAWPVDPARTAHVVIDLQTGFIAPGAVAKTPMNLQIMPNVNRLSAAVRAAGGLNIFIRFTYDPGWTAFYGRFSEAAKAPFIQAFTPGDPQHELWPGMEVLDGDLILDKTRLSALIPGACDLDGVLKERGVDTLIVTGCVTNCCCESTVRDAVQMNYRILFVADGNAAFSDADHNGAVNDLFSVFGCDICTADEVIGRLQGAAIEAAA